MSIPDVRGVARSVYRRVRARERVRRGSSNGFTIYYPERSLIGGYVARGLGWDSVLRPIVTHLLPEETPLIADVGANIGASLLQMKAAKPRGRFVCFEPSRRFCDPLRRTVARNGWDDVTVEPLMLGRQIEKRELHTNASTASTVARDYDSHLFLSSQEVSVSTLDEYFADRIPLAFLKIDTDGFDFDVLLGGQAILERDRPVIFFEFESSLVEQMGHRPADVFTFLEELGYQDFVVFSNFGDALETTRSAARILELSRSEIYLDLLTVHRSSSAEVASLVPLCGTIGSTLSIRYA